MRSDPAPPGAAAIDPVGAATVVLKGIGQVMFQEHAGTGLLFLAGIAVASPYLAAGALLGALIGPAIAWVSGLDRPEIRAGLHGFNPTLVGIAVPFLLRPSSPTTWLLVVVGCALCVPVAQLVRATLKFPAYTLPFILTTWLLLLAVHGALGHGIDADPTPPGPTAAGILIALFSGLAEVMFGANAITGLLFLAGIAWSDARQAAVALLGSLVGTLVSLYHSDPSEAIGLGIYGYNAALAAMALHLARPDLRGPILAAIVSVPLTEFFPKALGIPALTAPFVAAAWIVLAVGWLESRFAPAAAAPGPP